MKANSIGIGFSLLCALLAPAYNLVLAATPTFQNVRERSDFYRLRYGLKDTSEKLVDNQGDGYPDLYGTRNFREVLPGVLYRGGANNIHFKGSPRPNVNPLQTPGLENLCAEGFRQSIYLYSDNFSKAPKQVNCQNATEGGAANSLAYQSLDPFSPSTLKQALTLIRDTIVDPGAGPIYAHCWNGWHASGMLSAATLIQFCGVSNADAIKYWNLNTDGNDGPGYSGVRKRIQSFAPLPGLEISDDARAAVCPNFNGEFKN